MSRIVACPVEASSSYTCDATEVSNRSRYLLLTSAVHCLVIAFYCLVCTVHCLVRALLWLVRALFYLCANVRWSLLRAVQKKTVAYIFSVIWSGDFTILVLSTTSSNCRLLDVRFKGRLHLEAAQRANSGGVSLAWKQRQSFTLL